VRPLVRASYRASPPLVVAYALAGTMRRDLTEDPLGQDVRTGRPVYLRDLWPSPDEVDQVIRECVRQEMYRHEYARIYDGDEHWRRMKAPSGAIYDWDPDSTYVREPPYFDGFGPEPAPARVTGPAGSRAGPAARPPPAPTPAGGRPPPASPAGQYLTSRGVERADFNSYGARRGNHEVMVRGTFANIRLQNEIAGGREG